MFFLYTCVGIAAAIVHLMVVRPRRLGAASAVGVGVAGAWGGALLAAALTRTGWAELGAVAAVGSVAGAVLSVVGVDVAVRAHFRHGEA